MFEFVKKMRVFLSVAAMLIVALSSWSYAQEEGPVNLDTPVDIKKLEEKLAKLPPVDWRGEKETITVLGKTYDIVPFRPSQTTFMWKELKPFLPESLLETPEKSLSDDEVLAALDATVMEYMNKYLAAISDLTKRYLKDHPEADEAEIERTIGEKFHMDQGRTLSPEGQKLHNAYLASYCLLEMVKEAQGKGPINP